MAQPAPPGMIGLTHISGPVGRLIRFGQFLNGDGFTAWEHAFVMLDHGLILEAEPGGAVIRPLHYEDVYWCEGLYKLLNQTTVALHLESVAEGLRGTGYSFLDYAALDAHRLHLPVPGLKGYVADSGHMICSQMDDELYNRLGAHIFDDGRWAGYVTPGMLYQRDRQLRRVP